MKKIIVFEKIKRKFCDKVIILLAKYIQKCSKKEEFILHLEELEINRIESQKFRNIESKKENLFIAVEATKNKIESLEMYKNELLIAFKMVQLSLIENNTDKALTICNEVLEIKEK